MKTKVQFVGKIVDGQVTFANPEDKQYLESFNGQEVLLTVEHKPE